MCRNVSRQITVGSESDAAQRNLERIAVEASSAAKRAANLQRADGILRHQRKWSTVYRREPFRSAAFQLMSCRPVSRRGLDPTGSY